MTVRALAACLILVALSACRPPDEATTDATTFESQQSAIVDGTPDAVGLLAFLNASSTTLQVLDVDVPLDKRAAENLIAFRLGTDGVDGTSDDDAFQSIEQVDAVKWVGPQAMNRLVWYAQSQGWVPQGGDVLGVYDDVAFTVDEAAATLELANAVSHAVLDDDIGLDKRAADGIVAARPIVTMLELADVYFVGPSAMLAMREFPKQTGLANGATCTSHDDCESGLCVGLTMGYDAWCDAATMADDFTIDEVEEIPDGDSNGLTYNLDFSLPGTVPVDVVLYIDVIHPNKADLVVTLEQPGGGFEVIWDHEANPPTMVSAGWGIERDNMVNGTWTIKVTDTVSGNSGEMWGMMLWISSAMD
jgi:hypothetical protein